MAKPVIGIPAEVEQEGKYTGKTIFNSNYIRAIQQAGGIPWLYPATELSPEDAEEFIGKLDGLLLPGGGDVAPALYGEEELPENGEVNPMLDAFELGLARLAVERGMPVFGICRGVQSINVACGGSLYQDLPSQRPGEVAHRQAEGRHEVTHRAAIVPGTELAELFPAGELMVNSFHHQAVKVPAPGFAVNAYAPDGVIEGLECREKGISGVQFHPEELVGYHEGFEKLFQAFVDKAAAYRDKK